MAANRAIPGFADLFHSDFQIVWSGFCDSGFDIFIFEAEKVYDIILHIKAPFFWIDAHQNLKKKSWGGQSATADDPPLLLFKKT